MPTISPDAQRLAELVDAEMKSQQKTFEDVDIRGVARSIVNTLPAVDDTNRMVEAVGPFYDTPSLERWLGVTRQSLGKRAKARKLLVCKTADHHLLYPVWQFRPDGTVLPGLQEVLEVLSLGTESAWSWGMWLSASIDGELDGESPIDWLAGGGSLDPVLDLAVADAAVWAR